ncbi:exported hypothetical protein [Frankia canadensis]|uniref:Uncharacterized protein n=1 Tax=Frankia canadensis TaxID=1836972 RepID=A0A2I2KYG1_9ACTN|nr:hypothetical protein [Frankia canadensis]SNQ50690.1 exported hypothetical protein [Frankia canadensis]SOU57980.1 exported hypothetical protein [Frankia canadensis]
MDQRGGQCQRGHGTQALAATAFALAAATSGSLAGPASAATTASWRRREQPDHYASKALPPTDGMALTVEFSKDGQRAHVTEGGPGTVNDDGVAATEKAVSGTWHTVFPDVLAPRRRLRALMPANLADVSEPRNGYGFRATPP